MKDYMEVCKKWLSNPYFNGDAKAELRVVAEDENDIKRRFYMDLESGTAGPHGITGAGISRMSIYVIRRTTRGLANYIIKQGDASKGVAIAYGSRCISSEFAGEAARILVANGIKAYKLESLRPTSGLSSVVRELGCIADINVTANHDPLEYNGYKVYWEDGAQFTPPHDKSVTERVLAIEDSSTVKTMSAKNAMTIGLYETIGAKVDDKYVANVKAQMVNQDAISKVQGSIRIVYAPLHGTGDLPVRRALKEIGSEHAYVVPEQEPPDGEFPAVSYPNPGAEEAFTPGLRLAREKDANLALVVGPDAGRLGVYVKNTKPGSYIPLIGNMSGSLLCEYMLNQRRTKGEVPADRQVIRSIVTTNLVDAIAKDYNTELVEMLTGFKYIGQQILREETIGYGKYMFGLEESYGCLIGTYARNKDTVSASVALYKAVAYYRIKGMILWDTMVAIYDKYDYYKDAVKTIGLKGIGGLAKIQSVMRALRNDTPKQANDYTTISARDYKLDVTKDTRTGKVKPTGLPPSNVLYYGMNDDARPYVKPSETKPKIKFYYGIKGTSLEDADVKPVVPGEVVIAMVDKML